MNIKHSLGTGRDVLPSPPIPQLAMLTASHREDYINKPYRYLQRL